MSETPLKGYNKFNTITLTDKIHKNMGEAATYRKRTQRKTTSVLANPESIMNITTPLIDNNLSLPKIKTHRKQRKHGAFLQSWLDEALGSPDPFAKQQQKQRVNDDLSILKTIRKYQLDKRFLQSQNIPAEKIERLYQSLYIYSHGVNKVFQELLRFIKQSQNNDLLSNFWRAYTKLLQGSTSYQTVFQKVQKQHLQNICGLKNSIETRTQMFGEQRKQFGAKIKQLQKMSQQKQVKLQQLKLQYQVLHSTLTLTDQAFNEEVNLRLKFQQKINAIYTTYEQLKAKYTKIVEEMSIKNIDMIDQQNVQNQLKNKLLVEKTKVDELMFLLKAEKDKVLQRQTELHIKNQQLEDAKTSLAIKLNEEDTKHDAMEEHLSALKSLQVKLIETNNVISGQRITLRQQQQHIDKLNKSLEQYKVHNNQLYQKYAASGKKIVLLQSNIQGLNLKNADLQNQVQNKAIQIADLNRELSHTKGQRDNLRHELDVCTKNLQNTLDTMTKNNVILQDMKAVKDKYQRINQILKDQVKQLEIAHNIINRELSLKIQEFQGMKLLLDTRDKSIVQYQKSMDQEKQLNKSKVAALNQTITKKQNLVLQYQKKKQQTQRELGKLTTSLKASEDKIIIMQSERLKLQIQLSGKTKILEDLQSTLKSENTKYYQLNQKLEGQLKSKQNISSKLMTTQFVLKTKNEEERVQILSLSSLLNQYKSKLVLRAQHIHPMVYQDALQNARRCYRNEVQAKDKLAIKQKQMVVYIQTNKKLEVLSAQQKAKIEQYEQKVAKQAKLKIKLNETIAKLEQSLKNINNLYEKEKDINRNTSQSLQKKKSIQIQLKQKVKQLESLSTKFRIKNEELTYQIQKLIKSRDAKREIKKQFADKQMQTDYQQEKDIQVLYVQKQDKQIQTDSQQIESRQMTIEIMKPIYEQMKQSEPIRKQQKQTIPQKKVETKDFKKALKLTYMRR